MHYEEEGGQGTFHAFLAAGMSFKRRWLEHHHDRLECTEGDLPSTIIGEAEVLVGDSWNFSIWSFVSAWMDLGSAGVEKANQHSCRHRFLLSIVLPFQPNSPLVEVMRGSRIGLLPLLDGDQHLRIFIMVAGGNVNNRGDHCRL